MIAKSVDTTACNPGQEVIKNVHAHLRPHKTSGLIWIHIVLHSDGIPLEFSQKKLHFEKKNQQTTKKA